MINKNPDSLRVAVRSALSAGIGLGLGMGSTAAAQDDVAIQQKVTVTGSRIKRLDYEGPLPVTVIDREAIDSSGDLTVADVLRSTTYNSFGSFRQRSGSDQQAVNEVSMRGLGADKTLVLLNGRRMAGSPASAGQAQNLSVIPLAAVERIEILRDGASAIYGTDAIAGVINIILREDYEGMQLRADVGRPTQTGGDEEAYSVVGGVSGAKGNLTFAFDAQQREIVFNADRSFTATGLSSAGFPSNYFAFLSTDDPRNPSGGFVPVGFFSDPRCPEELGADPMFPDSVFERGACRYNYASVSATESDNDTYSLFVDANYDITENTSFFTRGLFSFVESFGRYAPAPAFGLQWGRDDPNNPTNPATPTNAAGDALPGQSFGVDTDGDGTVDFSVAGPFDLSVFYRNVPTGPRDGEFEDQLIDYTAGVQGTWDVFNGMDWQLAAQYSEQKSDDESEGVLLELALNDAVASGELDIFGITDPTLNTIRQQASGVSYTQAADTRFRLAGADGQINFDAFSLDNGEVPVALGFEYRDEDFDQSFDEQTQAGAAVGAAGQVIPVSGARTVKSLFAETAIPLLDGLELNFAARYDDYSDFGTTLNPKASVAFRPIDSLLLRASFGRGFQAPSLTDLFTPTLSNIGFGVIDTYLCSMDPADTDGDGRANVPEENLPIGNPCNGRGTSNFHTAISGGNRELDATESDQWSAGFIFNPVADLAIGVDYYNIDIDNEIDTISSQDKLDEEFRLRQEGATGNRIGNVVRASGGRLVSIESRQTNIAKRKTDGIDVEVSYAFRLGRFGDMNASLYWSHVLNFEQTNVEDPTRTELIDGEIFSPKNRGLLTLGWALGDFTATIQGNYISNQSASGACDFSTCRIPSVTTWDVQATYATPFNGQLTIGARNVLDQDPPFTDGVYSNYQHDVFGRVPYIRWEQEL